MSGHAGVLQLLKGNNKFIYKTDDSQLNHWAEQIQKKTNGFN